MNSEDKYFFFLTVVILLALFFVFVLFGCSTIEQRKQQLQEENPDCYVFDSLVVECPNPFNETSSFGTSVINQKPMKKTNRK